jgi:hypothetical protein
MKIRHYFLNFNDGQKQINSQGTTMRKIAGFTSYLQGNGTGDMKKHWNVLTIKTNGISYVFRQRMSVQTLKWSVLAHLK